MAKMAIDHYIDLSSRMLDPKHILEREAEVILMKNFPNQYRSKEKIIMFGSEKYH